MSRLYAGRAAPQWWQRPPGIAEWPIDPASGLVLSEGCAPADGTPPVRELFLAGREPTATCPGVATVQGGALEGVAEAAAPSGTGEEGQPGTGTEAEPGMAGSDQADAGAGSRVPSTAAGAAPAAPGGGGGPGAPAAEQAEPDSGAPAPGGGAGTPGNLGGWWEVTNTADAASLGQEHAARVTYRIALRQEGTRISGEGEKWAEDGRPLPAASRTPIGLAGSVNGREVRLHFVERGPLRATRGTFLLHLSTGGGNLSGTFVCSGADAHGASSAVRLR